MGVSTALREALAMQGSTRTSEQVRLRLLESVVVHANDAVLISEAEPVTLPGPRIVYVNPAFTRMTGYTIDEVIGKTPRLLQGPQTSSAARSQIRAALAAWHPITIELLNYRKDQTTFWVELSITPVADETGRFAHWIAVQRDISDRRSAEEGRLEQLHASGLLQQAHLAAQVSYSARHDGLTGLLNRTHFMEILERTLARSAADSTEHCGLITLDLDRFRDFNDRFGYSVGDCILRDIARRLEVCVGPHDTIARIGGDEFAILLADNANPSHLQAVADRVLSATASQPDFSNAGMSVSFGIVRELSEYYDAHTAMRDADTALTRARRCIGNAVIVFTEVMRDEAEISLIIRNDLQHALERGELQLYYQPLIDIALSRVYGFEGLLRWAHPTRDLIPPADFIPIAEMSGFINEIGSWVLLEGCRMAREFAARAGYPILMSLNVSSQQLLDPGFIDEVQAALQLTGLDPQALQLEITESIFVGSATIVGALFARIRALGVRIALDDFGTGYSSLSYLENFQIDTLKIDQSFVARIDGVSVKSEIVRMIVTLAHSLGAEVVTEGIETRFQRDALADLGCTHLQGYLFSRPVPAEQAMQLFETDGRAFAALSLLLRETVEQGAASSLTRAACEELRAQVHAALHTHQVWMERLAIAVKTGHAPFDRAEVAREDRCPIGLWLNFEISDDLRDMPLYAVTKARHAAFHRSMARLLTAVVAGDDAAGRSLGPDGDVSMAAASLVRTLHDWLAVAALANHADTSRLLSRAAEVPFALVAQTG